ncbi:MAG: hypothetical protein NTX25_05120 [Proteobacteria bacterium]|nr:hypothetical protein [Pseudomonadota bacterium]
MNVKTSEEWQSLVDKLESSGLSKTEFFRVNQIGSGRFYEWAKKFGGGVIPQSSNSRKEKQRNPSKFIEIELENTTLNQNSKSSKILRILTSYGATLEIPL